MADTEAEQRRRATFITKDNAAELGRKGAAARAANQARRKADPALAVRQDLSDALPDLVKDLLSAAKGMPPYETLPPDKRLSALFKALEYAAGRPVSSNQQPAPTPSTDGGEAEKP